jgi:parallel beta-helix repeat protein
VVSQDSMRPEERLLGLQAPISRRRLFALGAAIAAELSAGVLAAKLKHGGSGQAATGNPQGGGAAAGPSAPSAPPTKAAAAPDAPAPAHPNSTTTTQPGSKVPAGARSVKDFGAVGNGSADDTAAIQRAMDAGPGTVFLPAGTYLVSRQSGESFALHQRPAVRLLGEGDTSLIKLAPSKESFTRVLATDPGDKASGVVLESFAIDGNGPSQNPANEQQHGIFLSNAQAPVVRAVTVVNMVGDCIYLHDGTVGGLVERCNVRGWPGGRVGINLAGASNSVAQDNHCDGFTNWALKMETNAGTAPRSGNHFLRNAITNSLYGISLSGVPGGRISDTTIEQNVFQMAPGGGPAVRLRSVDRIGVLANQIAGASGSGIQLESDTTDIAVRSNAISGVVTADGRAVGISVGGGRLAGPRNTVIQQNTVSGCSDGVALYNTTNDCPRGTTVVDNDLRDNARAGLVLADSISTNVQRNRLSRNGEAGMRIQRTELGNTATTVISNAFTGATGRQATGIWIARAAAPGMQMSNNSFTQTPTPVAQN